MSRAKIPAAAVAAIFISSASSAATFDEATLGDAGNFPASATSLGSLSVGTHTVSGTVGCSSTYVSLQGSVWCGTRDQDHWDFDIADGLMLTSASAQVTDSTSFGDPISLFVEISDGSLFGESLNAVGSTGEFLSGSASSGTGFSLRATVDNSAFDEEGFSFDYTFTLVVEETPTVPLPATGLLLVAGFGGFAAFRRRKA